MDEAVLRRPHGSPDVMRAQLRHLLDTTRLPHVTLKVVPFSHGGHAAASGSFSIPRSAERDLPDIVDIEQLTSAVYLDQRPDVEHYLEVALPPRPVSVGRRDNANGPGAPLGWSAPVRSRRR